MSTQALNSDTVRRGMKDILLNNAGLYETLRQWVSVDQPPAPCKARLTHSGICEMLSM